MGEFVRVDWLIETKGPDSCPNGLRPSRVLWLRTTRPLRRHGCRGFGLGERLGDLPVVVSRTAGGDVTLPADLFRRCCRWLSNMECYTPRPDVPPRLTPREWWTGSVKPMGVVTSASANRTRFFRTVPALRLRKFPPSR